MPSHLAAKDILTENLIGEIVSFFPVLEGYIVEVKGDSVFLDLGAQSGVKKGMEFLCIREGEEFTHPITGNLLGHFEDKLGIVQIVEIKEKYSIAKILERFSGQIIKRGDKIRISAAKIPIALPPDPFEPDLNHLIKGLNLSGRFSVAPRNSVMAVLSGVDTSKIDELSPSQIKKIGEQLDIYAIILPSIKDSDGHKTIHIQIISARTGAHMTQISHELRPEITVLAPSSTSSLHTARGYHESITEGAKRFKIPPQEGILASASLSQELPMSVRFIAIGDITGDGKNEICATDGQNISVFSWTEGRLKSISQFKGAVSEDHLSLDTADINNNGRVEIFVSNVDNGSLRSFVLEWQGDRLKSIWDTVPLFLRAINEYPDKKVLMGQAMGMTKPFDSRIHEYKWDNGKYIPVKEIELPKDENILDIGMADLDGDGQVELACLDRKLTIYRNDKKIWKSESEYGGKAEFFEHQTKGAFGMEEEKTRVPLSSHLMIKDLNGNGRPEIILIKNISSTGRLFPQSPLYRRGEVCLIEWNGISFSEIWCSGKIDAYLTDIGIGDFNFDGAQDLVLSMVLIKGISKFWEKSQSKILLF